MASDSNKTLESLRRELALIEAVITDLEVLQSGQHDNSPLD
jgi:hypothetical protein